VRIAENRRDFSDAGLIGFISARASTGNPNDSQTMFTGKSSGKFRQKKN
jgi:hypothetical protein